MRNEMSKDAIRLCIKRQELWDNPELNETLYLHHKGFTKLKNLDDFTQVRVLFLESNNFHKIENLHNLKQLEKLHLQKNRIGKRGCVPCLNSISIFTLTLFYQPILNNSREDSEFATFYKAKVPQLGTECNHQDTWARISTLLGHIDYK